MNNIILVGNPNTGKTTLFNTLTKSNEKASNWHGVTVNVKNRRCKIGEYDFLVYDVPGMYSLNAYSNEEKIASEFLSKNKDALIVNICDANNIERNLKLTIELIEEGYNIVLAVNMVNENNNINYKLLERELGVVVIPIDARSLKSVLSLCKIVNNIINKKSQKTIKTGKILYNNNQLINNFAKFQKDKNYNPYKITDKIDKFVLNKWLFVPLFLVSLLMIFYITFGSIGMCFSNIFNMFFNKTFGILRKIILCTNMSYIIKSVICDGLFVGIESVVSFIPQIVLLIFFLNLLEDTGIMSRIAFMFDGVLKKIGLTGKSLFSLMLGLGCTTTAVLTTRNLENRQLRKRTVLLLPFISCSAKLPVFLVISSLFFEKYKFIFVFLLYLFSIAIAVIFASIYKKIMPDNNDLFLLEMPKYIF